MEVKPDSDLVIEVFHAAYGLMKSGPGAEYGEACEENSSGKHLSGLHFRREFAQDAGEQVFAGVEDQQALGRMHEDGRGGGRC